MLHCGGLAIVCTCVACGAAACRSFAFRSADSEVWAISSEGESRFGQEATLQSLVVDAADDAVTQHVVQSGAEVAVHEALQLRHESRNRLTRLANARVELQTLDTHRR